MVIKKIYMLSPLVGAQIRLYPAIQRRSGSRAWTSSE
nr:MAG TPA: hypothetical protein [Caudoviricetes sp.]